MADKLNDSSSTWSLCNIYDCESDKREQQPSVVTSLFFFIRYYWGKQINQRWWISWPLLSSKNLTHKTDIKRAVKLRMVDLVNLDGHVPWKPSAGHFWHLVKVSPWDLLWDDCCIKTQKIRHFCFKWSVFRDTNPLKRVVWRKSDCWNRNCPHVGHTRFSVLAKWLWQSDNDGKIYIYKIWHFM